MSKTQKSYTAKQTLQINGTSVTIQSDVEAITQVVSLLSMLPQLNSILHQVISVLDQYADENTEAKSALDMLHNIENLSKDAVVEQSREEHFKFTVLHLRNSIRKDRDMLEYYENQYAKEICPYQNGELYREPSGRIFMILDVRASRTKKQDFLVYGAECFAGETPDQLAAKNPVLLKPTKQWEKIY